MYKSVVNLGAAGPAAVSYMQEGGAVADYMAAPDLRAFRRRCPKNRA